MIRALPLALALAAALLATPTPTHAQEDARSLFRAGVESLREGEFTDAERAFLASYEIEPRAATLCNLALTYDRWGGHEEQAARAYERCAAEDDTGRYRAHATQRASDIRQALSLRQALGSPPGTVAAGARRVEELLHPVRSVLEGVGCQGCQGLCPGPHPHQEAAAARP